MGLAEKNAGKGINYLINTDHQLNASTKEPFDCSLLAQPKIELFLASKAVAK